MDRSIVATFTSSDPIKLDEQINDYLRRGDTSIINVSLTNCYDPVKQKIVYAATVAFNYYRRLQ